MLSSSDPVPPEAAAAHLAAAGHDILLLERITKRGSNPVAGAWLPPCSNGFHLLWNLRSSR